MRNLRSRIRHNFEMFRFFIVTVVVGVWPTSISRHMSHRLEAQLLYQRAHLTYKPNIGSKIKPHALPRSHIWSDITYPDSLLNQSCATPGTPIIGTRILFGATRGSDTKTLLNLSFLRCLQLDGTIPAIFRLSYVIRSMPQSKCYNAPYINASYYGWYRISLHGYPNNQMAWSKRLREIHNVQIMQLYRSEIPVVHYTTSSSSRRGFASDCHRKHHTQVTLYFPQTKILILTLKGFWPTPHRYSWPKKCSFFFCVFIRINQKRPIACDGKSPPQLPTNIVAPSLEVTKLFVF